ncbi:MAG: fibronectin type III domain-containing protein [Candidatus Poribacteria bacterium]|nr:fibronectin type III domain-containing protein [Candidatus Poribacteria bacterium]
MPNEHIDANIPKTISPRRLRLTRRVASRAIFVGVLLILTSLFTIEGVATVPGVPTGLTATAGDRQVKLSWTAPTDIGSSPINDYTIYYYTTDPNVITEIETGEVSTTTTLTGLTNGTLYTFMVSAWNDSGFGSESSSATATPNIPTPTGFTASSGEDGQVTLDWTAPSLVTVTRYEYNQNGGTSWTSTGTTTSATVTGLTNGTQYTFSVRVVSANGNGTASSSETATPTIVAPTGLTAPSGEDGQVTLSWTAPSVSTITGYQYKRDTENWASAGTSSPYTVTGLTNGVTYNFRVRAVGTGGGGTASSSETATPTIVAPTGLTAAGGDGQVTLSWTAPSVSTITGYQYKRDSASWVSAGTSSPYIVTGLVNGDSYTFKVRAIGAGGNGMESGSATGTPTALPPPPPPPPPSGPNPPPGPNPPGDLPVQSSPGQNPPVNLPVDTSPQTPPKRKIIIQECPVGYQRTDRFGRPTQRVLLYEVKLQMDLQNLVSIYKPDWVAIYVHPDEALENLEGWKLQVAVPYNHHRDYLLTAENSVVVDANIEGVEGGFAFIESPEEDPFPMVGMGFTGATVPGFDYRLYDDTGRKIDFGIACYKQGGIFQALKEMEDPRVLRNVLLESLDWDAATYIRSEWTVPTPAPAAPSLVKKTVVGTWANLKKQ